jgi:hypothetical protein
MRATRGIPVPCQRGKNGCQRRAAEHEGVASGHNREVGHASVSVLAAYRGPSPVHNTCIEPATHCASQSYLITHDLVDVGRRACMATATTACCGVERSVTHRTLQRGGDVPHKSVSAMVRRTDDTCATARETRGSRALGHSKKSSSPNNIRVSLRSLASDKCRAIGDLWIACSRPR